MQPDLNLDLSKTYIFEGNEYILTGRVAERSKDLPAPRQRRSRRSVIDLTPEQDLMVEIQPRPKNRSIVSLPDENRWVKLNELYAVMNVLEDEGDMED